MTAELNIGNVSSTTLELYEHSFQAFKDALESRATVVARVAELREKGMKPVKRADIGFTRLPLPRWTPGCG